MRSNGFLANGPKIRSLPPFDGPDGFRCCPDGPNGPRLFDADNRAQRDERKTNEQLLPPRQRKRAVRVRHHHGVVIAVRIQVEAVQLRERFIQHTHIIRRDESARFGVVITAVQIVETRLFVVVIPAITERVDRQNVRAALREDVTPCVVLVFTDKATAAV